MRARIRSIKPEVLLDEELWDLGQETGLPIYQAWTGLWLYADREGRLEWRPRALGRAILPFWDGDFELILQALTKANFLVRYEVEGKVYAWVRTFKKHQSPNAHEPKSVLPGPAYARTEPPSGMHMHADARTCLLGTERNGTERNSDARTGARGTSPPPDDGAEPGTGSGTFPTDETKSQRVERELVAEVVEEFAQRSGSPSVRVEAGDARFQLIAQAIGQFTAAGCKAILDAASRDDRVNGRGEFAGGEEHWTIEYIFRASTAERLFKAAQEHRKRQARRATLNGSESPRKRSQAPPPASEERLAPAEVQKLVARIGR